MEAGLRFLWHAARRQAARKVEAMPGVPALVFSLFLLTLGAILTFGVTASAEGIEIDAVGVILMVIGLIGITLAALFGMSWAPYRRRSAIVTDPAVQHTTTVERPVQHTTTTVERPVQRTTTVESVEHDERPLPPAAPPLP